jgi:hypothetical protein
MMGLNADVLCEGHFGIYQGKEKVSRFIQSYLLSVWDWDERCTIEARTLPVGNILLIVWG